MSDPLNEAMYEATLATLLGSTHIPTMTQYPDGTTMQGTMTVEAAFASRLRASVHNGELDDIMRQALANIDIAKVTSAFEQLLAKEMLRSINERPGWNQSENWLQREIRSIAVAAAKAAVADDEELMDTLRSRIGAQVDRNRVSISVQLTDPETASATR